jgi:endonuclease III
VSSKQRLTLRETVEVLRKHYGPPRPPPTADAFELILWANVAYLASPQRRREAFELLTRTVGTSPKAILSAPRAALEKVTSKGILKSTFAAKLRECARIAASEFGGDLETVTRLPLEKAKRALGSFPGIGEPGAERILLFSGRQALLAPDSNALRVLVRLGLVREGPSYPKTYAAAREVAREVSADVRLAQQAHLLLHHHGQTLCRRSTPACPECPLVGDCAYARRPSRRRRQG